MSSSDDSGGSTATTAAKYRGVRCRKWGKWVSEIRVPGTQDRLWLGSYSTPEAAATAHDIASYCLRGASTAKFNFPLVLPAGVEGTSMSPRSIQKVASDAGMAIDARFAVAGGRPSTVRSEDWQDKESGEICSAMETGRWQNPHHNSVVKWAGSESRDNQPLSISVEDYL